jgi:hypothetical protein
LSGKQTCKFCNEEKELEEFYSNGCFSDGTKKYRTRCKKCVLSMLKTNQQSIYACKVIKRSSSYKNFISSILNHASQRKQHLGFNIDLIYLLQIYSEQNGLCAISGVQMTHIAGCGKVNTNISIDRIDSSKGYVRGNVQFVCDYVNRMKQNLLIDEMLWWCDRILEKRDAKI